MTKEEAETEVAVCEARNDGFIYWADYTFGRWIVARRPMLNCGAEFGMKEVYRR